jgi:hypothetical protein
MKHLIENNQIIRTEGRIPAMFEKNGHTTFGYDLSGAEDLYADGWRDEVIPAYDPALQQLGAASYDPVLNLVTYPILDRSDLPVITEAKAQKVTQIKQQANYLLGQTDWYVIRNAEKAKVIPSEITSERERIRARSNELELAVMSFDGLREVLMFGIEF